MPTSDIIGYLWSKRQALDIQTTSEAVSLTADLLESGVDCIQVEDIRVLGSVIGVSTSYPRKTEEEWDRLVHDAILRSAVANTVHMMIDREDDQ